MERRFPVLTEIGAVSSRTFATLAVAILLIVLMAPLVMAPGETGGYSDVSERTITYYQSQDDYDWDKDDDASTTSTSLSQTYYGIATSEYNPQYWGFDKKFSTTVEKDMTFTFKVTVPRFMWSGGDVKFVAGSSNITLTSLTLSDNEGNVSCDSTAFTLEGWGHAVYERNATVHLGIKYSGPAVFTGWVTPDGTPVEPGDVIPEGVDSLIATWSAPDCFMTGDKRIDDGGESWYVVDSREYSQRNTGDICNEHSDNPEYTTIINMSNGTTVSGTVPSGTYRGGGAGTVVTIDNATLGGDAVFDSMSISNRAYGSEKHGDQNYGLFANGKKLILGTGLTLPSGKGMREALQVFGGSNNGDVGETHVLIHSGVYYNVVAGGWNGTVEGSTYLVMRGGTVLDTIIGGNGGQSSNTVGSTYVYIVGGKLPADSYVEGEMTAQGGNDSKWAPPSDIYRDESTIITGGSNNGTVKGDTNVFISGTADVWDVQAGGRRGSSTVSGAASMEISGMAVVRHVACGSITDGNSSNGDRSCVNSTDITVKDGAKVASVYGAGYDTYASVSYVSMMGGGSTISISVESGTVGYVYGGGYRGSVGTPSDPIESITIEVSGGLILGDVFGGGRGGVDKAMHNQDGSMVQDEDQSGMADSTGLSKVYAGSVNIRFTGGTVKGNVFGGGESVPVLQGKNAGPETEQESAVAEMVVDTVNIYVGDCVIDGSVYGAGKGLTGPGGFDTPKIFTMLVSQKVEQDGSVTESCRIYGVDWYEGSGALFYDASRDYSDFAKVTADGISITFDGYRTDDLPQATGREGSIYGGGMFGIADVSGTVSITIEDSTVSDSVFGGGEGTPDSTAPGSLSASTVSIWVSGTKTIIGKESIPYSVIGGGRNALVTAGDVYIVLEDGANLIGDVHGGGLGSESSSGSSFSTTEIMDANRVVVLNGASVYGNIYGGSRLGQDGNEGGFKVSTVAIIDGTVTQSVYGGGFQGVSYLDSKIYIGTPAREIAQTFLGNRLSLAPTGKISMVSVFGGGNLSGAESGSVQSDDDSLLKGGVTIEIGYVHKDGYAMDPDNLRLEGDLFGEGNYSSLSEGKTAFVYIHDWKPSTSTIKSIQRCDELLIENSRVELLGSMDGAVQGLTDLFSLAGVGKLQLDRSVLELNSATTRISEYVSTIDGDVSERDDCIRTGSAEYRGNEIVLHEGRPLTLVDYTLSGSSIRLSVGTVSGFTLLTKSGDDSYYGAFAIGAPDETNAAMTGFMVNDGEDEASVVDRVIAGQTISTWYLAGHFTLSEQVVFDEPGPDATSAVYKELDFHMPRLYRQDATQDSTTVYTYIASYVTPTIQDGMYVVDGYEDYSPEATEHRTYLSMTLKGDEGTSAATHKLNDGGNGWDRKVSAGHVLLGNSSMLYMDAYLQLPKTVDGVRSTQSVGMLGEITIQLSESLPIKDENGDITGYVPVNMIDLEISVYVRPYMSAENVTEIFVTVMTTNRNGTHSGRGYINLPSGDGDPITFRITSVDDLDAGEDVDMWSDTTHLGLSGWTVIRYPEGSVYNLGDFRQQDGPLYFGEGGLRDTTIAFDYTGDGSGFQIILKGTPNSDDPDSVTYTYKVTVRVQEKEDVLVDFSYDSITEAGKRYHLYVSGDGLSPDTGFTLVWAESAPEGYSVMSVPYGTLFTNDTFFSVDYPEGASMREVVEKTLEKIEVTVDQVQDKSNYREFLTGWFVDPDCISGFNTASPMSESMTLYAGLGVTVTFDGRGAGVNPQSVLLKPGQSLSEHYNNLDGDDPNKVSIWNGVLLPGKHLHHIDEIGGHSWMVDDNTPWNFNDGVFQDLELYLLWVDDEYIINVEVTDEYGTTSSATLTVSGTGVTWDNETGEIGSKYGVPVTVNLDGTGSIITDATLTWDDGSASVVGVGTRTISFVTPDPGDEIHAVPKEMTLAITVSLGFTMTVDVVSMDNGLMVSGDRLRMYVGDSTTPYAEFSSSLTRTTLPIKEGDEVELRFEFVPGSSNQGREDDVYWSYTQTIDGSVSQSFRDTIRGKTQSPYFSEKVESDIDLKVEVYVAVNIASIGEGISEVHVYEKTESSDPLEVNDILFAGEPLYVYASSGYYLPPSTTTGLSPAGQYEDGPSIFTVIGNRDVVLGDLSRIMVKLKIDVVAIDQMDNVIDSSGTWTLTVTVNQSTVRTFSDVAIGSQVTMDVPMNTDGTGYSIVVSSDGFDNGSGRIDSGSISGKVELTLIEYTIVYLDSDGNLLSGGTGVESWNILKGYMPPSFTLPDGASATAIGSVPGYNGQIWTVASSQAGEFHSDGKVVTLITTGQFASGTTLYLMAVPVQQGGFEEIETLYITLRESDFGRTLEANLFDSDVTFHLNGYEIVYEVDETTGTHTLALPEEFHGVGTIMLESRQATGETVRLVMQVVPEGAGDMDSMEVPDIVTKTI